MHAHNIYDLSFLGGHLHCFDNINVFPPINYIALQSAQYRDEHNLGSYSAACLVLIAGIVGSMIGIKIKIGLVVKLFYGKMLLWHIAMILTLAAMSTETKYHVVHGKRSTADPRKLVNRKDALF